MSAPLVLVFSHESLAAALIGAAVEVAGFTPVFPYDGESPRDAVMRVRPRVALVDCDHPDACTEAFFGPALMVGARTAVFSSARSQRQIVEIAKQFRVARFTVPIEFDQLKALLRELAGDHV